MRKSHASCHTDVTIFPPNLSCLIPMYRSSVLFSSKITLGVVTYSYSRLIFLCRAGARKNNGCRLILTLKSTTTAPSNVPHSLCCTSYTFHAYGLPIFTNMPSNNQGLASICCTDLMARYWLSFVSILENTGRVIMAPHCKWKLWFQQLKGLTVGRDMGCFVCNHMLIYTPLQSLQ